MALPKSSDKLAILAGRAARGEPLHHPDDRRLPDQVGLLYGDDYAEADGLQVVSVRDKPTDLLTLAELAEAAELAPWVLRHQRENLHRMPEPTMRGARGVPLWRWSEIRTWLEDLAGRELPEQL